MDILNGGRNDAICGTVAPEQQATPTYRPDTYEIQLKEVENGFVVRVGCKHFVALSWEEVASKLGEYFKDPDGARKKYCRS